MARTGWSLRDAPSQAGRVAVVTGANSGIGRETARQLAGLGAHVVLACRNPLAADEARDDIAATVPGASLEVVRLDLGDQSSVADCADTLRSAHPAIDLLINNAGVMRRHRELTVDGFEADFGTNFLGHFALTARLLPALTAAPSARVVTVGSKASGVGGIAFDDLPMDRSFSAARAYSRSKLAQMVFAVELQRRLDRHDENLISVGAHPGATQSGVMRDQSAWLQWLFTARSLRWLRRTFIMAAPDGALVTVRAATDEAAVGAQYYGPRGLTGFSGPPVAVGFPAAAGDPVLGEKLWETAEKMTGLSFGL
ncbi:MAG: oxidoreductase [Gordonia sp. (in: high G+C Gram-positive bacteria)]